jgi:hypothetical protein
VPRPPEKTGLAARTNRFWPSDPLYDDAVKATAAASTDGGMSGLAAAARDLGAGANTAVG